MIYAILIVAAISIAGIILGDYHRRRELKRFKQIGRYVTGESNERPQRAKDDARESIFAGFDYLSKAHPEILEQLEANPMYPHASEMMNEWRRGRQ